MTPPKYFWFIFLAVAAAASLSAAEITGKVRDASGDAATVVIDGDALPAVGDSAEIFFKIPGADEEISVASGKVAAVEAKVVKLKIEKTTGTIEKDQLARIKSGSTSTTAGASPSPAASLSPAASPSAATSSSIVGDWVGPIPDGKITFSFKADGTMLWEVEDEKHAEVAHAKYRIDPSTQPRTIELFEIDQVVAAAKGENVQGIFEFESNGRLKLDFGKGAGTPPLKEFTKDALVLSKATSPFVRSNKPARPTPPPPSPDEVLAKEAEERYDRGDDAGAIEAAAKAIEQNPKNARAYFYRGLCFYRKKDWPRALPDFEKAMELDPSMKLQDMVHQMKILYPADELVKEGDKLFEREDYDGAIEAYTKAIAINPKNKWAFYGRGNCFFRKKDRSAGIADHEKVMELDPDMKKVLDAAKIARESREEMEREKSTPTPTATRAKTRRKP